MVTLRQARIEKLLTQRDLAVRAGISLSTVHLTETGQTIPRLMAVRKIAAALDVEPASIAEFAEAIRWRSGRPRNDETRRQRN